MKKLALLILSIFVLFTGCDNKIEIDESLVANTAKNKPFEKEFVSKTFKLTTLKDKTIELTTTDDGINFKDYKNKKVILLNVFATWCPPCIKEIPTLLELKDKYKDDFEIISVLFEKDKTKEEILEFVKKYKINYPITMGEENFRLAKDLNDIQKIPEMFLFTKNGEFVKKFVGETTKETFIEFIDIALSK